MKNNLLKFLLLLNGILSILATCPVYPTIPTTSIPKTNPLVLTSTSKGMVSLDPSLTKFSITITVTLDEQCPSGGQWKIFTLTVTPSGGSEQSVIEFYIECDTFDFYVIGYWFDEADSLLANIFRGSSRTVNVFATIDLESKILLVEVNSAEISEYIDYYGSRLLESGRALVGGVSSFDETTKLYLCSNPDGASSALACTVSRLQLVPTYLGNDDLSPAYLGDFTPVTQAFYPLIGGELSSLIKSSDSAYFGDKASSPTAGSSPSWDSSKSFVQISSATQFLTLPIPSMAQNSIFTPTTTFAFWTRITSIPQAFATLFSILLEDGTPKLRLLISRDTLKVSGTNREIVNTPTGGKLQITLNAWQLISCSFYFPTGQGYMVISLSVGDSQTLEYWNDRSPGLTPTKMQIGDSTTSFIGDISSAQILSSGAGYLTNSDTCSPNNAIEINSGPYAISCAEGSSFNPLNNKCYSSCPAKTEKVTPFTDAPFTLCFSDGSSSGSVTVEESSGGLSGGAIAGIVVGGVAGVALVAAAGYYLIKIKSAKSVTQWAPKDKAVNPNTSRKGIVAPSNAPSNIVSPAGFEEISLR